MDLTLLHNPPDLPGTLATLVAAIPAGKVATFGQLAKALGDPRAAIWASQELRSGDYAWAHRVVGAGGISGKIVTDGHDDQLERLRAEGVPIVAGLVDLDRARAELPPIDPPLAKLRALQSELSALVSLESPVESPKRIAGFDVSYGKVANLGDLGTAACVVLDAKTGEKLGEHLVQLPVRFPYIPTYLTFREMPLLLAALAAADAAGQGPDLLMIDGTGILHPHRAGIATMFGVATGRPTIGVTKSRLCGSCEASALAYGSPQPIRVGEELRGMAILPTPKTAKPLYVSPAHRQSVADSLRWVEHFLNGKNRSPLPILLADRISRDAAKLK